MMEGGEVREGGREEDVRGRKGVRERVEGKRGQVEVIRDIVRRYRPCSATIEATINLTNQNTFGEN